MSICMQSIGNPSKFHEFRGRTVACERMRCVRGAGGARHGGGGRGGGGGGAPPRQKSLDHLDRHGYKYRCQPAYAERIRRFQERGIEVYGTFIVGLDGDGPDIFERTADFILQNHLYGANITVPTPLPGTQLRREMEEQGRIGSAGWDAYTLWDVVARPLCMSAQELEDGLLALYQTISAKDSAEQRLRRMFSQRRRQFEQKEKLR